MDTPPSPVSSRGLEEPMIIKIAGDNYRHPIGSSQAQLLQAGGELKDAYCGFDNYRLGAVEQEPAAIMLGSQLESFAGGVLEYDVVEISLSLHGDKVSLGLILSGDSHRLRSFLLNAERLRSAGEWSR